MIQAMNDLPPPDSLERLTHADLIGVVRDLIGEVTRMRAETEKLGGALAKLRVEHQAVKDELARLKHLPPRPPIKPSGMDKSTQAKGPEAGDEKGGRSSRRCGSQLDRLKIGAIIVVKADPPAGSRNKGFEDIVVQDLSLNPQVTRYRRERWETPDGKTIIAALDPGLVGGYGPNLHRLVLTLHFSGQVTCERIAALLNGMGGVISKRQVVRLLTAKLETFRAEDEAVLKAGLCGAYVTVDDTGARHAGKNGYTTQIGSYNFTTFRTGPSKSRLAFLSRLCGGVSLYVINDAALAYMEERNLPQIVIGKFKEHKARIFSSAGDWERHLQALVVAERVGPVNRIGAVLATLGVGEYNPLRRDRRQRLDELRTALGGSLPTHARAKIVRMLDRLELLLIQIAELEKSRDAVLEDENPDKAASMIQQLAKLRGVGLQSATVLVREGFVREFANGKALGSYAGLTSTPYSSGGTAAMPAYSHLLDEERDQIGHAGRLRPHRTHAAQIHHF